MIVTPDLPSRFLSVAYPLKRGQHVWKEGVCPVRVYDGARELPAQVERICRYPDGSAASIMVYADAGSTVGSVRAEWDEHREPQGEFEYHAAIRDERQWFARYTSGRVTMDGPVVRQFRINWDDQIAWATFFNNSPAVRLDILVHNALPGARERISSVLCGALAPYRWEATWTIVEPLGTPDGIQDSASHFTAQRAQRIIRAVLAPIGYQKWTEAHPTYGWATLPAQWQSTNAWAPHFIGSPDLAWRTSLQADQGKALGAIKYALANGTPYPTHYPSSTRLGFFHPSYASEGGETSGYGITYAPPGDVIQTGSPDALMRAFYEQRMRRDRDRSACIEADGEPSTYEQRQTEIDTGKIRFSSDDPGRFDKTGSVTLDGSFGWSKQIPAPASPERTMLLAYETTDFAHRIRATSWDLTLLQLANDPVSRYLIRMDGEVARMSWHSAHRDDGDRNAAQAGLGLSRDRILGWQLHAMATAYCAGGNALRDRFEDDLRDAVSIYSAATTRGPTVCALQSGKQVSPAPYLNQYAVCVSIQEGLLVQGFVAAARAVGRDDFLPLDRILRAVEFLRHGSQTVWSAAVWDLTDRAPFTVRGLDSTHPAWTGGDYDSEQTRGLLGLVAFLLMERGEPVEPVVDLITWMLGNAPRAKLRSMGAGVLDSDSLTLAACDRLGLP
jgi:hypothetical protein